MLQVVYFYDPIWYLYHIYFRLKRWARVGWFGSGWIFILINTGFNCFYFVSFDFRFQISASRAPRNCWKSGFVNPQAPSKANSVCSNINNKYLVLSQNLFLFITYYREKGQPCGLHKISRVQWDALLSLVSVLYPPVKCSRSWSLFFVIILICSVLFTIC